MAPESAADSAGRAWAGRTFESHDVAYAADDGAADPRLLEAIGAFRSDTLRENDVVDALREARLLIPLVAHAGAEGVNDHGVRVDKTQELAIVTVAGPDGRDVLPAFTSVDTLRAWDPAARPVPAASRRVAIAAAAEQTELLILDPGTPTQFGLRRPALWALAQDLPWLPSYADDEVAAAVLAVARPESAIASLTLRPGSATASLEGPELVVSLALRPGLDRDALGGLLQRIQQGWAADEIITRRVDSLAVKVTTAPERA